MNGIVYHNVLQGGDRWHALRCGLLTASEMKHIITPKNLKYAANDKERSHLYELAAQRVTKYVEPSYVNDDMLRGIGDEVYARDAYSEHFEFVQQCGFITNDKWGFTLGYSPDGLVGKEGLIESKSRRQKFQLETIVTKTPPSEHMIQVQTGMLVAERQWCDFISYCGGMPMAVMRVFADELIQTSIVEAATLFHEKLDAVVRMYAERLADKSWKLIPTERRLETEII